jgi:hypothetical protein
VRALSESPLYRFELVHDVLAFRWTERTARMTEQDFKDAVMNDAGFALEHRPLGLLIDTTSFRYPAPTPGAWRDEAVVPRYLRAGVTRMAYVAPGASAGSLSLGNARGRFEEASFTEETAAIEWLHQPLAARRRWAGPPP